jgi:hypothetical protein
MTHSAISAELLALYHSALFHVYAEPDFTLYIGRHSVAADNLMRRYKAKTAVFITACNPYSNVLSDRENQARNNALEQDLITGGFCFFSGLGQDPKAQWPDEPSFFVLNISMPAASALGQKYQQNAVVWNKPNQSAELMLLR